MAGITSQKQVTLVEEQDGGCDVTSNVSIAPPKHNPDGADTLVELPLYSHSPGEFYATDTPGIVGFGFHQLLHTMSPRPLVLCGPSGVGKSTLMKKLLEEFGPHFGFSVSHTTRLPRPGEEHGKHYYFVKREEMEEAIRNGEFIEHAKYSGNLYGTSKKAVHDVLSSGRICILDIDTQGVIQVKKTDLRAQLIFIKPPSVEELKKRLEARGTETEESLARRLCAAEKELEYGAVEGNFDKVIVNDVEEDAYQELRDFMLPVIKEKNND